MHRHGVPDLKEPKSIVRSVAELARGLDTPFLARAQRLAAYSLVAARQALSSNAVPDYIDILLANVQYRRMFTGCSFAALLCELRVCKGA